MAKPFVILIFLIGASLGGFSIYSLATGAFMKGTQSPTTALSPSSNQTNTTQQQQLNTNVFEQLDVSTVSAILPDMNTAGSTTTTSPKFRKSDGTSSSTTTVSSSSDAAAAEVSSVDAEPAPIVDEISTSDTVSEDKGSAVSNNTETSTTTSSPSNINNEIITANSPSSTVEVKENKSSSVDTNLTGTRNNVVLGDVIVDTPSRKEIHNIPGGKVRLSAGAGTGLSQRNHGKAKSSSGNGLRGDGTQ